MKSRVDGVNLLNFPFKFSFLNILINEKGFVRSSKIRLNEYCFIHGYQGYLKRIERHVVLRIRYKLNLHNTPLIQFYVKCAHKMIYSFIRMIFLNLLFPQFALLFGNDYKIRQAVLCSNMY